MRDPNRHGVGHAAPSKATETRNPNGFKISCNVSRVGLPFLFILFEPGAHLIVVARHYQPERVGPDKKENDAQIAGDSKFKEGFSERAHSKPDVFVRFAKAFAKFLES
jgi:hypothetical protein